MTTYRVEFEMDAPDDAAPEEVEAFLRFELGEVCQLMPSRMSVLDLHSCNVRHVWVRQEYKPGTP